MVTTSVSRYEVPEACLLKVGTRMTCTRVSGDLNCCEILPAVAHTLHSHAYCCCNRRLLWHTVWLLTSCSAALHLHCLF